MSTSSSQLLYSSKNVGNKGKFKKETIYKRIKDYYLKIALTGDNKLLFRCYDMNKLDCYCYQLILSADEIFDLYEDMKIYETSSVLFNVITKRFSYDYSINYDKNFDKIIIETNNTPIYESKIKLELHRENITCLKEYIFILCQTIKQLKEDASILKESKKKYDSHFKNINKIPSIFDDVKELKTQVQLINTALYDQQIQIDKLRKEKDENKKIISENKSSIKVLEENNKNLKVALGNNREEIEKLQKIKDYNNYFFKKMTIDYFNRKYRTNIGYNIKYLHLEKNFIGNVGLRDLCHLEFVHLERLNLSSNYIKDISPLEKAKYNQLKELILFFNNINDINVLDKVEFHLLTKLGLSDNYISNINVLENADFLQLEKLALSNNNIKNIDILSKVQFNLLRELKLSNNKISDISILSEVKFPKIKSLILSNNNISNIDVFKKTNFPILLELKLSNNKIKDIEAFENVEFKYCLKYLYLSHNKISNITSLIYKYNKYRRYDDELSMNFKYLKELYLAGNPIDKDDNISIIECLTDNLKKFII